MYEYELSPEQEKEAETLTRVYLAMVENGVPVKEAAHLIVEAVLE